MIELTLEMLRDPQRPFQSEPPRFDLLEVWGLWQRLKAGEEAVCKGLLERFEALMELGREHGLREGERLHGLPLQERPQTGLPFRAAEYTPGEFGVQQEKANLQVCQVTELQERHGITNWPVTRHMMAEHPQSGVDVLQGLDAVSAALGLMRSGCVLAKAFLAGHLEEVYRVGFEWGLEEAWELTGHQNFFWSDSQGFHHITLLPEGGK